MRSATLVLLFASFVVTPALGSVSATIIPGDTVEGDLVAGDVDRISFTVAAPATLRASLKTTGGLVLSLSLLDPAGGPVSLGTAVSGSPGPAPSLKKLPLTTLGTYTLVLTQESGAGSYRGKLKLGKCKGTLVSIHTEPVDRGGLWIDSGHVLYDGSGSGLSATCAEEAIQELDAAATARDGRLDALEGRLDVLEGRLDALESAVEAASRGGIRLLGSVAEQKTWASIDVLVNASLCYLVKRANYLSVTVAPGEIEHFVEATVNWTVVPTYANATVKWDEDRLMDQYIAWTEIGERQILFDRGSYARRQMQLVGGLLDYPPEVLGLTVPASVEQDPALLTQKLVYRPSTEEKAEGFTMDLYLSNLVYSGQGAQYLDFTLVVDSAQVVGR